MGRRIPVSRIRLSEGEWSASPKLEMSVGCLVVGLASALLGRALRLSLVDQTSVPAPKHTTPG